MHRHDGTGTGTTFTVTTETCTARSMLHAQEALMVRRALEKANALKSGHARLAAQQLPGRDGKGPDARLLSQKIYNGVSLLNTPGNQQCAGASQSSAAAYHSILHQERVRRKAWS